MKNVRLEYMYRDSSNYKAHAEPVIVAGPATDRDLERIRATLSADGHFICEQVGLPPADFDGSAFGAWEDDHPWHELTGLELTSAPPNIPLSIEDLLMRFESVAVWMPALGRQVDDDVLDAAQEQRTAEGPGL